MNAIKAVEIAKRVNGQVGDDILYEAIKRLERMIEKYAKLPHKEFDKNAVLTAAGGVYDGYDDIYTLYLKREAALHIEDWNCFPSYDALFVNRWDELCKEIVRTHEPEKQSFGPDWRWT